jgi:subtilisin family serine protease
MFGSRAISAAAIVAAMLIGSPPQANAADQRYIIKFTPGAASDVRAAFGARGIAIVRYLGPQSAAAAYIPEAALAGLRNHPSIEYIEKDPVRYPMGEVSPYGIALVQADRVADDNAHNRTICIIDSGYDLGHADLAGNMVTGTSDPGGAGYWDNDGCGHGTHVTGTVAAQSGNDTGVIGTINGGANLHIVKVFDAACTFTYSSDLINALNACEANGANIVSMSLGCTGQGCYSELEAAAFQAAYDIGLLSVASAGNSSNTSYSYPASHDSVISVAAVDSAMNHVSFSQQNDQVELAAPGLIVRSTVPVGTGMEESVVVSSDAYEGKAMVGSPDASASGELIDCGYGDSVCANAAGRICLMQRGGSAQFNAKVLNCQDGGGVGAVIYNNDDGLIWGTLSGTPAAIPSVGISATDGAILHGRLGELVTVNTTSGGHYEYKNGTSMAAPHVSGVAALIWSQNPSASNQAVRDALNLTALDLGIPGPDNYYGSGLVQAEHALDCLLKSNCTRPNTPPRAAFTVSCAGLVCDLDASGSSDLEGASTSYSWDFGDGPTNATGQFSSHTYASSGTYTATLTVTDNGGAADSSSQAVMVSDNSEPPVASFTYVCSGKRCAFDGRGSTDDFGIVDYTWEFGDGSTLSGINQIPTHSYVSHGNYTVTLTVSDAESGSGNGSAELHVKRRGDTSGSSGGGDTGDGGDSGSGGSEKGRKKCTDGIDNDGDGLIDGDDPDC